MTTKFLPRGTKLYRAESVPLPPNSIRPFAPTYEDALMFSTVKGTNTIVIYELTEDVEVSKVPHNYGYFRDGLFRDPIHRSYEYKVNTDLVRPFLTTRVLVEL